MRVARTLIAASVAAFLVAGCSTKDASRTFQTSVMLCTEEGATLKIDGEQLNKAISGTTGFAQALSTYAPKTWKPEGDVDRVSLGELQALLEACRRFLSNEKVVEPEGKSASPS